MLDPNPNPNPNPNWTRLKQVDLVWNKLTKVENKFELGRNKLT